MTVSAPSLIGDTSLRTCLSSDAKPTDNSVIEGSKITETDTQNEYEFIGGVWVQTHNNGAKLITSAGAAGAVDSRFIRFDAAADMPADITSAANVSADRVKLDTFASTARRIQLIWHGESGVGVGGTNSYGPAALGAIVTINAGDDATADARLTYTDLTGGGSSSSGKADVFMVSPANHIIEMTLDTALLRIDAIGIPAIGVGTPVFDACFLEVRVLG